MEDEAVFNITTRKNEFDTTLYIIKLKYKRSNYYFRWAYSSRKTAEFVKNSLRSNFGWPSGVQMDLDNNYLEMNKDAIKFSPQTRVVRNGREGFMHLIVNS